MSSSCTYTAIRRSWAGWNDLYLFINISYPHFRKQNQAHLQVIYTLPTTSINEEQSFSKMICAKCILLDRCNIQYHEGAQLRKIMSSIQQAEIYDSNQQTDHHQRYNNSQNDRSPKQNVKIQHRIQQYEISEGTIQQFIQLIRKNFKNFTPEALVNAAYHALGLQQQYQQQKQRYVKSVPMNPEFYPNFGHPAYNVIKYPQTARVGNAVEDFPRKRGRPRKSYEQQKRAQNIQGQPISQYQFYNKAVEQSKQDKERQLAQILVEQGYGISIAKKRVLFDFEINFYYNSIKNILYRSFKKLEEKVRTQCKQPIQMNEEHKTMKFRTELCSFNKWLPPDQSQTFKQYIKSVYDLNPEPVSKGRTVRLYRNILARWHQMKNYDGRFRESNVLIESGNSQIRQ